RAIAHALDVDLLIEAILEGNGYRENSFLSSAVFGHDASLARYAYDPARARELLEEAGYAGGFDLTVHAPSGLYMKDREVAIAVAGMLREVGIDAQAESLESGAWNELLRGDGLSPVYFV